MSGADLMLMVYDLPIVLLVISTLISPLVFIVAFSPRWGIWVKAFGGAVLAACSITAGWLYLIYRVIMTWNTTLENAPVPSLGAAITEFCYEFAFHLTGALMVGAVLSYFVLRDYRDMDAKTYLLTSLSAGAICSLALVMGAVNPMLYLFAVFIVPALLWEVYYELRRRGSVYTRYFRVSLLLLIIQVCAMVVYIGILIALVVIFHPVYRGVP